MSADFTNFYDGCSVQLRNGKVVHNVHKRGSSAYIAYTPGSTMDIQLDQDLCMLHWDIEGSFSPWPYSGTHANDIEEVIKKDTMELPERNTDAFIEHVVRTMLHFQKTGKCWFKYRCETEWRSASTPVWKWDTTDYHWQDPSHVKSKEDVNAELLETYEEALKEIASMSTNILAYDRAVLAQVKATQALGKTYPHDWSKDG